MIHPPLVKSSSSYGEVVDTSFPGNDPSILLLGTASMKPGKYRNVSGI